MIKRRPILNLFLIFCLITMFLCGCIYTSAEGMQQNISGGSDTAATSEIFLDSTSELSSSGLTVCFLDVGQADAALISCGGHHMLIDGGNKDDSSLLYSLLQSSGISHLDLVIGTHADEDHIGGLPGAFYYADADLTLCSTDDYDSDAFSDFKKYAALRGGGIVVSQAGDTYELGDALVEILAVNSGDGSNDTSIVAKLTYGQTSFLFTGDAEINTERFLLESGSDLSSTVLKVAHHGSRDSSSEEFLQIVSPEYAVISVGTDNNYGHPDGSVLQRLHALGSEVYRTDIHGTITCYSDGVDVTIQTEYPRAAGSADTGSGLAANGADINADNHAGASSVPHMDTSESYGFNYILNIRSKKFHKPSCESVSKMSAHNRLEFSGTREEVLALDYSPCGSCKP